MMVLLALATWLLKPAGYSAARRAGPARGRRGGFASAVRRGAPARVRGLGLREIQRRVASGAIPGNLADVYARRGGFGGAGATGRRVRRARVR